MTVGEDIKYIVFDRNANPLSCILLLREIHCLKKSLPPMKETPQIPINHPHGMTHTANMRFTANCNLSDYGKKA